jgi:hypothetical protein
MMLCAVYERAEGGTLQRWHEARAEVTAEELSGFYPHVEGLKGWPESRVYWTRATGPAFGVAPIKPDGAE